VTGRAGPIAVAVVVALAVTAVAAGARAEPELIEVGGSAAASGTAGVPPRQRAIDDAFANAVRRAVEGIVAPAARERHRAAIEERVVRRARLFVAKYRVRQEGETGGVYRVRLEAWIDTTRVRDLLIELGVEVEAAAPADPVTGRPRLALLLVAVIDGEAVASFGRASADGGDAGRAIRRELREYGFEVADTAGVEVELAGRESRTVGEAAAVDVATRAGAGGAVVVSAAIEPDGKIRGTRLVGSKGRADVHVIDVAGPRTVVTAEVEAGAFGASAAEAAAASATELGVRTVRAIAQALGRHWPEPVAGGAGLLVEVRGAPAWQLVEDVTAMMRQTSGVSAVIPRRFRRGQVALVVTTQLSARRLAATIASTPFPSASLRVQALSDRAIQIDVSDATVPSGGRPPGRP
jgi:hypothetical protein